MKALLFVTTLFASLATQAAVHQITDPSELKTVKEAVILAIPEGKTSCLGAEGLPSRYWTVAAIVSAAQSASKTDGEQPLLTFVRQDNAQILQVQIVSSDKQKITRIYVDEHKYEKINRGDLINPKIEFDWVFQRRVECEMR